MKQLLNYRFSAILLVGILTFLSACESDESVSDEVLLMKNWIHSYEENANQELVYRPHDFKTFEASWYRQYFEFSKDHVCQYLVLAPNDAHYVATGIWYYEDKILSIQNADKLGIYKFEVLSLSEDLLQLRVLPR